MNKRVFAAAVAAALLLFPAAAAGETPPARLDIMTGAVYDEMGTLSEGLIWALRDGQFAYLDENGRTVISAAGLQAACAGNTVMDARDFSGGLAVLYTMERAYYIDREGKPVFSADWGFSFSGGVALGFRDGELVLFDTAGGVKAVSLPAEAAGTGDWDCGIAFSDGLLPFWVTAGGVELNGYVDTGFNLVIPLQFEDARPFSGGLAPVKKDGKWGFIDTKGVMTVPARYDDYLSGQRHQVFHDGLAAVKLDGKWGFIDKTGAVAVPFQFDGAGAFSEGRAAVVTGGRYGYIDTDGRTVIGAQFDDANGFFGGAALVGGGGVYRLIGPDGKALSPLTWHFDGTLTSPGSALYSLGGKRGLLKLNGGPLDSADGWAVEHIEEALAKGFLPEELQGSYAQPVTRAEFVTLAMSWLRYHTGLTDAELTARYAVAPDRTFTDTADPVILAAARLDITAGIGGGQFGVNTQFNREQAAMMLMKVHNILNKAGGDFNTADPPDFGWADILEAGEGMRIAVNFAGNYGVMSGSGGRFNPKETFSRQHSITVFNNIDRRERQ